MSKPESELHDPGTTTREREFEHVEPPIGWDGQTLQEMLDESEQLLEETGRYQGLDELELKENDPFKYEQMYSRLRGALVSARETALHVSASPIVREIGELCFQIYTPEGDSVAVSTGIIVHVHTGSLAIKYMIEEGYETNRGIQPGDVFCNNDNDLGNVHTTDVHTFVPIFYEDELVAWADGVTHEIDIGGMTRGHDQVASTNRHEDGLYATCEKIGEDDKLYQDWRDRGQRGVRTPMYWDLDEKCRLAGCHMIREAIHEMIDEVGVDTFKQFLYEAVEEGRQIMESRVKERMFPGTYRETGFHPIQWEDKAWQPGAQQNMMNHLPVEMTIDGEGGMELDMEGATPPGPHPFNCAKGSMEGALWVYLTQSILHDGKVNDGAHYAVDTNYPEGTVVNPQDPELSYHTPWLTIFPTYLAVSKCLSNGFFSRGFREEVITGYGEPCDALQGGGKLMDSLAEAIPDALGDYFPVGPFDFSCQGLGASACRDGLNYGYAMFNPEADLGDVEEWEQTQWGLIQLARRVKPNTAGHGKYRGGSGWEGLHTVMGSEDVSLYALSIPTVTWSSAGMSGGYPGGTSYSVRAHDTDLAKRTVTDEPYPLDDMPHHGRIEDQIDAEEVIRDHDGMFFPEEFENYDLLRYQTSGGPGWGDPLERPPEKLKEDIEKDIFTPDVVEEVYGVVGDYDAENRDFTIDEEATAERRAEIREERAERTQSFEEFFEEEQARVKQSDWNDGVQYMYEGVFETSEEWAQDFREFWDLGDGYSP
ncbi:hydantoinase B/oxoprolinase family protein [Haloglomus halophilum]|uniref:hydantoinase B/oxoprolinase family protein n=1 Tax=Haloglomus halophilum TaxID=2962672 RepID=UPI0020C980E6|nr:hydantoinase B/oxoprolinase family protein [Haloglomus halophilum]